MKLDEAPIPAAAPRNIRATRNPIPRSAANRTYPLLVILAPLIAYMPAALGRYGYADDYAELAEIHGGSKWIITVCNSLGRPIEGIALETVFGLAKTIENLAYIRAFIIAQLLLLAFLIYRHFLKFTASQLFSALAAVFIITLPPFEFFASYATAFMLLLPAILTYPVYGLISGIRDSRSPDSWLRLSLATVLLLIGLCTYQPPVLFICFWFLVDALLGSWDSRTILNRALIVLFAVTLAGVLYLIGVHYLCPPEARMQLTNARLRKAAWFITFVIPNTFRFHLLTAAASTGIVIAASALIAIAACSRDPIPRLLTKLSIGALILPISFAGSLVAAESFSTYRSRMAMMPCAALLLIYAAWLMISLAPALVRQIGWAAILFLACAGTYLAAFNVFRYIVYPQTFEYAMVRSNMVSQNARLYRNIRLVEPGWTMTFMDSYNLFWGFDEFGLPTSAKPKNWGMAQAMVRMTFLEMHPNWQDQWPNVTVYPVESNLPDDPSVLTIDMRKLSIFK